MASLLNSHSFKSEFPVGGPSRLLELTSSIVVLCAAIFAWSTQVSAQVETPDSEMVLIPGGVFDMGCNPNKDDLCEFVPEENLHTVEVGPFYMDVYEVTTRRYRVCVEQGTCPVPTMGGLMHFDDPEADRFPINGVSWHNAVAFCTFEGKRLPTSAEWEFAARGTDGRIFPWGDEAPSCERNVMDRANAGYLGCGTGNSLNVGSIPAGASPFGVMEMAGNGWEWVSDWYDETYYFESPVSNPQGPESGVLKITRGGDFLSRQGYEVRSSGRFPYYPGNTSPAIGFRCVKDV
jgi:formylglycine-generating enzyme required for sulfatase activity